MTTRPGNRALGMWSSYRTKRACSLVKITRKDGFVLRFTDHDRAITFEGGEYVPVTFAGMSAERREAALRSGNQDLYGIIDGQSVLLPDLLGHRYRDAEVAHVVTDWRYPWLVIARHRKFIRNIVFNGTDFVATIEGRAQVLSRPAGGDLSGSWVTDCPKRLGSTDGDHPCMADIAAWEIPTATVQTVPSRLDVTFTSLSWPGTWDDDEYRHGELEWITGENVGHISLIVSYRHSTRAVQIRQPTPNPIEVGDQAIARVGCDGLYSTCKDKFSNGDNFGGDPLAPSSSQVVEPAEDQ